MVIALAGSQVSETLVGIAESVFIYADWEELDGIMEEIEKQYVPINEDKL